MRFKVTTPKNPEYNGLTFGVQFNNGAAIVDGPPGQTTRYGVMYADLPEKFRNQGRMIQKDAKNQIVSDEMIYVVEMLEPDVPEIKPAVPAKVK